VFLEWEVKGPELESYPLDGIGVGVVSSSSPTTLLLMSVS
jgi:hypothetical protein